jgi:hypothetical protein
MGMLYERKISERWTIIAETLLGPHWIAALTVSTRRANSTFFAGRINLGLNYRF